MSGSPQLNHSQRVWAREKFLEAQPSNRMALKNVMLLLEKGLPLDGGRFVQAARRLSHFGTEPKDLPQRLDVEKLRKTLPLWSKEVLDLGLVRNLTVNQIFYGLKHPLLANTQTNCSQLLGVFAETKVIPLICFGCYKVQIRPRSVVGLIQTHFLLKHLPLARRNFRKSMIEMREAVTGPYKAYVYCDSESEAIEIKEKFQSQIGEYRLDNIQVGVSHGCSEYGLAYPDFRYRENGDHRDFRAPSKWEVIEKEAFSKLPSVANGLEAERKPYITLREATGLTDWIIYAKIIGDTSVNIFGDIPINKPPGWLSTVSKQAEARRNEL